MSWHAVLLRSRKIEQVRKQEEEGLTDLPESQIVHYVYGERRVLHALWERHVLYALWETCSHMCSHVLHAFDKLTYYYVPECFFFFGGEAGNDHETNIDK